MDTDFDGFIIVPYLGADVQNETQIGFHEGVIDPLTLDSTQWHRPQR